eukprot:g2030.t1
MQVVSTDLGRTWSSPRSLVPFLGTPIEETGPGLGLQLSPSHPNAGRILFIGSNFIRVHVGAVWYSDDNGATYRRAKTNFSNTNEAQLVELPDGRLMANLRNQGWSGKGPFPCHGNRDEKCRAISISADGGESWGALTYDDQLPGPGCFGSLLRHGSSVFFSNPASTTERNTGLVRRSDDGGKTFAHSLSVTSGRQNFSYSVLTHIPGAGTGTGVGIAPGMLGIAWETHVESALPFAQEGNNAKAFPFNLSGIVFSAFPVAF